MAMAIAASGPIENAIRVGIVGWSVDHRKIVKMGTQPAQADIPATQMKRPHNQALAFFVEPKELIEPIAFDEDLAIVHWLDDRFQAGEKEAIDGSGRNPLTFLRSELIAIHAAKIA